MEEGRRIPPECTSLRWLSGRVDRNRETGLTCVLLVHAVAAAYVIHFCVSCKDLTITTAVRLLALRVGCATSEALCAA